MQTRRWTNPSQPQTLQIAVFLFYINAAFSVLFGTFLPLLPLGLLLIVGMVATGFGIANEMKWGYWLGVVIAGLSVLFEVVLPVVVNGPDVLLNPFFLIGALFPVALLCLVLHPQSRDYQRIWFS